MLRQCCLVQDRDYDVFVCDAKSMILYGWQKLLTEKTCERNVDNRASLANREIGAIATRKIR